MKTVTLKMSDNLARELNRAIKKSHYGTQTEFIRGALREKLLDMGILRPTSKGLVNDGLLQVKQSLRDLEAGRVTRVR